MPIPKEILEVKRPRNTIVIAYGKTKIAMPSEKGLDANTSTEGGFL